MHEIININSQNVSGEKLTASGRPRQTCVRGAVPAAGPATPAAPAPPASSPLPPCGCACHVLCLPSTCCEAVGRATGRLTDGYPG